MLRYRKLLFCFVIVFIIITLCEDVFGKQSSAVIENIIDPKDFKKLLRTKNNVLVCFVSSIKKSANIVKIFREAAESVKGEGTMILIDCSGDAKKLCKKYKISTESHVLKHYKDGDFHKDYDRKETVSAMLHFMRDPGGEIPWEEDDSSTDVIHLPDIASLTRLVKRQSLPVMVMFYAPWCGFCKQLKPDYAAAATDLKGQAVIAAIDVNRPENAAVRTHFNITGFPTLLHFDHGKIMVYEGENKKDNIVAFMKDPTAVPVKPKEDIWADGENEVTHLTDENFESVLASADSALVMFYAPWCGHCKRMKPDYERAAVKLKDIGTLGILAALDATKSPVTAKKWGVRGYPTLKFFKRGEFQFDASVREETGILEFMRDPKEPPPPPPPETPWHEQQSEVLHLTTENFKTSLKKKKHALVMFYAPWCGHCKKAKPEFTAAADRLKDDPRVALAAVDCTVHASVCSAHQVSGYPTCKLFHYLNKEPPKDYNGGRTAADFLQFMAPFSSLDLTDVKASTSSTPKDEWKPQNVQILDTINFDAVVEAEDSLLVLFYAPWCGHCTRLKGPYDEAGKLMQMNKIPGKLAAIDVSVHSTIGDKFSITGLPTVKYFRKGVLYTTYKGERTSDGIVKFMKNPPVEPDFSRPKEEL